MTIHLAFFQSKKKHPIPAYSFWEYYVKNGIIEGGHTWQESENVDWAEGLTPMSTEELSDWKTRVWSKTVSDLKINPTDIFLSYLYPHQVDTTAIEAIKAMGIICINFFCDNVRDFNVIPKEYKVFNLNWVPEFKALNNYKKAGLPYIHLPMPMWVAPKYRTKTTEENSNISFIGSKDLQRLMFFEECVEKQIELNIYGAGWNENPNENSVKPNKTAFTKVKNQFDFVKKFGLQAYLRKNAQLNLNQNPSALLLPHLLGKPDFENYIKVTQQSLITLGINRYPSFNFPLNNPNSYSKLRDIEAPMLGACYLTEYTDGLEELYEFGKEIEIYKTGDELLDKINYLSANKSKRDQLRLNGQLKALNAHSIPQSLNKIYNKIFK